MERVVNRSGFRKVVDNQNMQTNSFLLTHSMEQSPSWEASRFSASQEIPAHFMEPDVSLPHWQVPATCPFPEPARSSPHPHIPLPEDPSKYYPPIYSWVSQVVSFPQVSPLKPCIRVSSASYALHIPPIPFFSILSTKQYWVRSTDH